MSLCCRDGGALDSSKYSRFPLSFLVLWHFHLNELLRIHRVTPLGDCFPTRLFWTFACAAEVNKCENWPSQGKGESSPSATIMPNSPNEGTASFASADFCRYSSTANGLNLSTNST